VYDVPNVSIGVVQHLLSMSQYDAKKFCALFQKIFMHTVTIMLIIIDAQTLYAQVSGSSGVR